MLRFSLGLAAAVGFSALVLSGQQPQPNDELLTAARRAWGDYEKAARKWSVRTDGEYKHNDRGKVTKSALDDRVARGNGRCLSLEMPEPGGPDRKPEARPRICKVVGPEYQFWARREPGSAEWALTSVTENSAIQKAIDRKDVPSGYRTTRDDIENDYLLVALSVNGTLVSRMIDHPCCLTKHIAKAADSTVEWRFKIDQSKRPAWVRDMESGRVVFDSNQRWVIREYQVDSRNGRGGITAIDQKLTYETGPGGYQVPTEIKTTLETDDRTATASGRTQLKWGSEPAPADKEFTLSAYGIPEGARAQGQMLSTPNSGQPIGKQTAVEPSGGWYYWLAPAGIGLVAAAILIRFLRTRRQAAESVDLAS